MSKILEVKNLSVSFDTPSGEVEAVRDVSLTLNKGEVLAIVGESGCGKSVMSKAIMGLLPGTARIKSGSILAEDKELVGLREKELSGLRGSLFSMVFQDPMTSLNPTMTIGRQIGEAVTVHNKRLSKKELRARTLELMQLVGIEEADKRHDLYPHNFSGGMRQRSVLAMAIASNPKILFADEPTTSLDVTIQASMLNLLMDIQKKLDTSIVFITHDLGVVAHIADRVAVMYAGKIIEIGKADEIFYDPRHPYTWGLLQALPSNSKGKDELYTVPGAPPTLLSPPVGDAFARRNKYALGIDYKKMPPMFRVSDTHYAATWLLHEKAPKVEVPSFPGRLSQSS